MDDGRIEKFFAKLDLNIEQLDLWTDLMDQGFDADLTDEGNVVFIKEGVTLIHDLDTGEVYDDQTSTASREESTE